MVLAQEEVHVLKNPEKEKPVSPSPSLNTLSSTLLPAHPQTLQQTLLLGNRCSSLVSWKVCRVCPAGMFRVLPSSQTSICSDLIVVSHLTPDSSGGGRILTLLISGVSSCERQSGSALFPFSNPNYPTQLVPLDFLAISLSEPQPRAAFSPGAEWRAGG